MTPLERLVEAGDKLAALARIVATRGLPTTKPIPGYLTFAKEWAKIVAELKPQASVADPWQTQALWPKRTAP